MRLTSFTDYAFRVLIFAEANRDRVFTIDEVHQQFSVSRNHLTKVISALTRGGFLTAVRGRSGGIRLDKEPKEINLGDVLKLTEPDFLLVECMRTNNQCILTEACKLPGPLHEAMTSFVDTLSKYTLVDIALNEETN
jgi:Rrf2 family nitric oxide-sensitive transcriptional repressor